MSIEAVAHVFEVLAATYGAAWDRSLGEAPLNDIKSAWAYRLSQFTQSQKAKRAIMWALENLPERAPNAIEFRNLCLKAPAFDVLALRIEAPADPARVAAELAKLGPVMDSAKNSGPKDDKLWAKRLQAKHESGVNLNANQIRCCEQSLGIVLMKKTKPAAAPVKAQYVDYREAA